MIAPARNIVVEYALKSARNPVGVAGYKLTKKLPVALKRILPAEEDLIAQVKDEMLER